MASLSADIGSRASALETIVANDYIDLLNSLPIIKLLHAKWVRGARGHYFLHLALFCVCLVFHALLCQHRRQGLADVFAYGSRESVLKRAVQSAAMCRSPYASTAFAPNGSTVVTKVRLFLTQDRGGGAGEWGGSKVWGEVPLGRGLIFRLRFSALFSFCLCGSGASWAGGPAALCGSLAF